MYSAVVKETDPKKKLALINAWKEKYSETEYKLARLQLYLNAYQQLNDFPNLLSTLNEMLTMNPKDLTVMSPIMYYTMVSNDVSPVVPGQCPEGSQFRVGEPGQQAGDHQ